jgi:hypothetical protein
VRANNAAILSALNRFSNTPRAITQIGLCSISKPLPPKGGSLRQQVLLPH